MNRGSKLMLVLLTASLALPMHAFAGDEAKKKGAAVRKPKPVIETPANCKSKSKVFSAKARDRRGKAVADRMDRGQIQGQKVEQNPAAVKKLSSAR